jgi:hypothetical protein
MDGQRESLLQLRIPVGRTTDIVLLQLLHVCLLACFLPAFKLRLGQQQPESHTRDQNINHAFPIRKYSSIYRIFFFFFRDSSCSCFASRQEEKTFLPFLFRD